MTPISHALLPVIIGYRWLPKKGGEPSIKAAGTLAFCGMLPDLVDPHLSLDSRHASWSHTLAAYAAFTLLVAIIARKKPLLVEAKFAALLSGAYLAHLVCDVFTGGGAFLLPFSSRVFGDHYLAFETWVFCDLASLAVAYVLLRVLPGLRRRRLDESRRPPL